MSTPSNRKVAMKVRVENGETIVRFHDTDIVRITETEIILKADEGQSNIIKARMNQVSEAYNLGYRVYQENYQWYVIWPGKTVRFTGNTITLPRILKNEK